MAERYYEKFLATFFAENDYSRALKLAFLIIRSDKNKNKDIEEQLEWISNYTTEELRIPFYKAWNLVSLERNPKKVVNVKYGDGLRKKSKEFTVQEIVVEVQKAHQRMYELMGKVASRYDISVAIEQPEGDEAQFSLPVID